MWKGIHQDVYVDLEGIIDQLPVNWRGWLATDLHMKLCFDLIISYATHMHFLATDCFFLLNEHLKWSLCSATAATKHPHPAAVPGFMEYMCALIVMMCGVV